MGAWELICQFVAHLHSGGEQVAEQFYDGKEVQELVHNELVPAVVRTLERWEVASPDLSREFHAYNDGERKYAETLVGDLAFSPIFPVRKSGGGGKRAFELVAASKAMRTTAEIMSFLIYGGMNKLTGRAYNSSLYQLLYWKGIVHRRERSEGAGRGNDCEDKRDRRPKVKVGLESDFGSSVEEVEHPFDDVTRMHASIRDKFVSFWPAFYYEQGCATAKQYMNSLSEKQRAEVKACLLFVGQKGDIGTSIHGVMNYLRTTDPNISRQDAMKAIDETTAFLESVIRDGCLRELNPAERRSWLEGFKSSWLDPRDAAPKE